MTSQERILQALVTAAALGEPCPTDVRLGEAACIVPQGVDRHIQALSAAGIVICESAHYRRRRVRIIATGNVTDWTAPRYNGAPGGYAKAGTGKPKEAAAPREKHRRTSLARRQSASHPWHR